MANRSWPGYGRSGTSPGRAVSAAVRVAGASAVARERRGSGDRRAPSPGRAPVRAGVERPPALGAAQVNSRAEPTSRSRGRLLPTWLAARARPAAAPGQLLPRLPTKRAGPTAGPSLALAGEEPGRTARAPAHFGWRAAVGALLALALFCGASLSAAAQTVTTFVSNIGQAGSGTPRTTIGDYELSGFTFKFSLGQKFTTGGAENGYTFSAVDVSANSFGSDSSPRVSIYTAGPSGAPGSSVYVLSNPMTLTSGATNTFSAPANATLAKETDYFVVFEETATSSASYLLNVASAGDEDPGAATGWSIADKRYERASDSGNWSLITVGYAVRIAIKGGPTAPNAPTGLTATPGDGSVTLRWTAPAYDGGSAVTSHQYRQNTTGDWEDIELSAPGEMNAASYPVTNLTNDTAYTFEVRARNPEGDSGPSNQASATPVVAGTAPVLRSATATALELALTYDEALDASSEPAPSAFTVPVDGALREVTGVSVGGTKVLLTLASAVRAGETVTVSYTVPVANPLQDAASNPAAPFADHAVTNLLPAELSVEDASGNENTGVVFTITLNGRTPHDVTVRYRTSSAMGATAIQAPIPSQAVGDPCYASLISGEHTDNPTADYEYTSGTVVFPAVSMATDPQTVTRTVTVPVCPGRTFPETGYWFGFEFLEVTGVSHVGEGRVAIGTILPVSEVASTGIELRLNPAEVTEGAGDTEVTVTALLNAGARTAATEVTVSVAGNTATAGTDFTAVDDFTVTIPAMQTSATTTFTFIPLQDETPEGDETLTVSGSATGLTGDTATLTLTDRDTRVFVHPTSVTVTEGGANASYTVKLATEPTGDVTVTVDGANEDVSVSPPSLTFTKLNWDRPQTVTVEAVNDSVAEREERVTLTHTVSGGDYDGVAAAPVSVQVVNNDVGATGAGAWLVRAGRTVAGQAMDVLTARLDGGGESYLALGEHRLVGSSGAALEGDAGDGRMRSVGREQPLTERELVLGSAFHLRSGVGEPNGTAFAAWGRIASDRFAGKADGLALDGEIRTSFVGADLSAGRWLAGTALAFSKGEGGYGLAGEGGDRAVASRLTSLFPYAQVRLSERVSAWGLASRGSGRLTLIERGGTGADRYATDIEMHMGAAGVGGTLATAPEGIELGLRSDVFWMRTSSDPIEEIGVASSELQANRLRLVLDASRPYTVGEGTTLTPSLEVGVRQDGGDAETGRGVQVGAGLRYAGPGFRIEGSVRGLAVHDESAYEEWGASGSVHIEPGGSGRGLSLTLAPAWGNPSSAGRRLWSARDAADLAPARDIEAGRRLDAEVGYGLRSPSGPGVVTPYAALSVGEGAGRTLRTGMRWRLAPAATLGLEASRAGSPGDDEGPVNALTLRASVRW